jgi:predicted transcriptional regulator of viral defense system
MNITVEDRLMRLIQERGLLRPRDLDIAGIPHTYLQRMLTKGMVTRVERGLYIAADADISEHYSIAEASKLVPHGVICLLSALRFHDIGTQNPFEVWMAIDRKAWRPRTGSPIRIVRFSGLALTYGVETHIADGVTVKVYNPAKTVADCFKYRNKIGLDVALESLRECWRGRKATMDELWEAAKVCRVANVMKPYMESLA